jgi:hypothetical protein
MTEYDPAADLRRLRRSADGLRDPGGSFVYEGGVARTHFPAVGIRIDVERIRTERSGDTTGDVSVYLGIYSELVSTQRLTLSGTRSRADLARSLAVRVPSEPMWPEMVDAACIEALRAFRAGSPAVLLRDLARPPAGGYILPPLVIDRHATIWFGDGGDLKSYLALAAGAAIQTGRGDILGIAPTGIRQVGILDYELSGEDHRDRLERITGPAMPPIVYTSCVSALQDDVPRIRRLVADHRLELLIVDSIGFACSGPPEAAEAAQGFYRALREIGLPALCIAHVTKAESGDQRPFGSTFWHNGARSTWYVKRSDEGRPDVVRIGLFNRKANLGPRSSPLGFRVTFTEGATTFEPSGITDAADLAAKLPLVARIAESVRNGARTYVEIAEEVETTAETVRKTIDQRGKDRFVRITGPDGITRWGLAT